MSSTTEILPFSIDVPQADLDDLQERLARTRFAQDLPGVGWDYGTPSDVLREYVAAWRDEFDWRGVEQRFNQYPQFLTTIDGQNVHFLHIRSDEPEATPLLLLHGWPGSFMEFEHLIAPLTDPVAHGGEAADAFHLVIPSMPGYGFSGPTTETGWNAERMGRAMAELMARLGYDRYGVQGGDMGAFVGPATAQAAPDHVIGVHLNAATYGFIPWGEVSAEERAGMSERDLRKLERLTWWNAEGSGYFQIQATRPQTIAAGLSDSPVGQLAWMLDSFKNWTAGGVGTDVQLDRETVLAHVSLYWLTNTAASSARNYWEAMHSGNQWATEDGGEGWGDAAAEDGGESWGDAAGEPASEEAVDWSDASAWGEKASTPYGLAVFGEDIAMRAYGEQMYTIVHWTEFDEGGHFAAMETPELLAGDVRSFFRGLKG